MSNENTLIVDVIIPILLPAVLKNPVLVGVQRRDLNGLVVGSGLAVEHWQSVERVLGGSNEVDPSHEVLLIGTVANGGVAVDRATIVAAGVHNAPVAHAKVAMAVSVGLVEVGQSQAVRELVAEGAHAIKRCAAVVAARDLVKHSKLVDCHAIACDGARAVAIVGARREAPLAGPHGLGHGVACLCLAHASIDHDAHVGLAVAIVVILRPVDVVACLSDSIGHHQRHALVVAIRLVAAIGGTAAGQGIDAVDVELRSVQAVTLVLEVVERTLGVGVILSLKLRLGVAHALVGVLHQNDGHAWRTAVGHLSRPWRDAARTHAAQHARLPLGVVECRNGQLVLIGVNKREFAGAALVGIVSPHLRHVSSGHIIEKSVVGKGDSQPVGSSEAVMPLVANRLHLQRGAIAQLNGV